ncbi:hypothetical protein QRX60_22115 [Amycolatopsis mongoliensis]|uniref:Uncharacterized protein n=1 Tax=Amycolatopsis mongoliensis TaxID=715475 RepID=A0A9Y2NNZ5_9PSEU|nr:hypothetical protein [Amycolatopsis sp. 4-36]WIY06408.1 hypothetical protein QRX60_22115 [Amycolatopsis sp. 4-36]
MRDGHPASARARRPSGRPGRPRRGEQLGDVLARPLARGLAFESLPGALVATHPEEARFPELEACLLALDASSSR